MDQNDLINHLLELKTGQATIFEKVVSMEKAVMGNGTPGLVQRVDSLESDRDKIKGLKYIGGGGGIIGAVTAIYHFVSHIGGK